MASLASLLAPLKWRLRRMAASEIAEMAMGASGAYLGSGCRRFS